MIDQTAEVLKSSEVRQSVNTVRELALSDNAGLRPEATDKPADLGPGAFSF